MGAALIRQGYTFDADGNLAEQWLIGDATCDGLVNSFDTDWFVAAILDPENNEMPEGYPGDQECWDRRLEWADVDGSGAINSFDVDPFVDVVVSGSAVARVFTWNAENKLVMAAPVQSPPPLGSQRVSFVYDYMGRRVEKRVETWTAGSPDPEWVETTRRRYIYDGWLLLLELDALESNAVVRQYTWGLDLAGLNGSIGDRRSAGGIGGLLAVHDETVGSSEDYIYFYDANGNVAQLVALEDDYGDATGDGWHADRQVARYEYDAYGRITGPDTDDDGDWRDDAGPYATTNTMRFSTKPWDDEVGWGTWGERLYEPRIGRWTNRDPIGELGGHNLYAYVTNHAVFRVDPRGESTLEDAHSTQTCSSPEPSDPCVEACAAWSGIYMPFAACLRGCRIGPTSGMDCEFFCMRYYDTEGEGPSRTLTQACINGCRSVPRRGRMIPNNPNQPTNGCSSPLGDAPHGQISFTSACNAHDQCYGTCGKTKATCDAEFLNDMMVLCQGLPDCGHWALIYHDAVVQYGLRYYCDAQRAAGCTTLSYECRR